MKKKTSAKVISQNCISTGIYDLWLETDLAKEAHAGQFIGVYTTDASKLLPRPISICQASKVEAGDDFDGLRLVYRVTNENAGTANISRLKSGDEVNIIGILGNGYDLAAAGSHPVLMGGGIGVPPILELAKEIQSLPGGPSPVVIAGYRNSDLFLKEDLEKAAKLYIATEDGSVGTKGNVLDVMRSENIECDVIMACGPMPMLRAIAAYARENGIKAYISLEERMACGVGACLGCVTKTKETDHHSHVKNTRICTDGPVFDAEILDI